MLPKNLVVWICLMLAVAAAAEPLAAEPLDEIVSALNLQELTGVSGQSSVSLAQQLAPLATTNALTHPGFKGVVGEFSLLRRLGEPWDHAGLLEETAFLEVLAAALEQGVITGYDLRQKGVYEEFPQGRYFVYSHGSQRHLQQLSALLGLEGVQANVYLTPKVSAFLYREDWGNRSDHVQTLPGGIEVVNGRESATLFEFANTSDQQQFHEVVQTYAKKDSAEESGLIADAWWQPFYYTDAPFADFPPIDLVLLSSAASEATLTVLPERTPMVLKAVTGRGFSVDVERVWVNPAFYRFLQGDYR